jgi:hypothetical protein
MISGESEVDRLIRVVQPCDPSPLVNVMGDELLSLLCQLLAEANSQ